MIALSNENIRCELADVLSSAMGYYREGDRGFSQNLEDFLEFIFDLGGLTEEQKDDRWDAINSAFSQGLCIGIVSGYRELSRRFTSEKIEIYAFDTNSNIPTENSTFAEYLKFRSSEDKEENRKMIYALEGWTLIAQKQMMSVAKHKALRHESKKVLGKNPTPTEEIISYSIVSHNSNFIATLEDIRAEAIKAALTAYGHPDAGEEKYFALEKENRTSFRHDLDNSISDLGFEIEFKSFLVHEMLTELKDHLNDKDILACIQLLANWSFDLGAEHFHLVNHHLISKGFIPGKLKSVRRNEIKKYGWRIAKKMLLENREKKLSTSQALIKKAYTEAYNKCMDKFPEMKEDSHATKGSFKKMMQEAKEEDPL